jgi:FdhD protein
MRTNRKPPQESLIRIFINGEFVSALLCTPKDLKDLAFGWLYNQGFIESVDDVVSLGACDDMRDIQIRLSNSAYKGKDRSQFVKTSACMGGEISYRQFFRDTPKLPAGPMVSIQVLKPLMKKALSMAHSYSETGGIHCAAIASVTNQQVLACFEDVGRHNALDKVIGSLLLARQDPEDKMLLTSGRISSEMVLKAAHSRIPLIGSITTCTDLAVRIAKDAGLTVVGRVLSASPVVWCGEQRIIPAGKKKTT